MLILTRYTNEQLLIGDAQLTILAITQRKNGRGCVKLGIEAPAELPIIRAELLQRDNACSNISAASPVQGQEEH